jgi:hypothetical protein
MNLQRKNNLLDVDDVCCARANLMMRSTALQNICDVNLTAKYIHIDSLKFPQHLNDTNTYIKGGTNGNFILDSNFDIPRWIRADQSDVEATVFNNNIDIVLRSELHPISFSNDFNIILNKPVLSDVIENDFGGMFSSSANNLSDVSISRGQVYSKLSLNNMVGFDIEPNMTFTNLNLLNLVFENIQNTEGILNTTYNTIQLEDIAQATTNTFGKGLLKNEPNIESHFVSSKFLNEKYLDLDEVYSGKNENYNEMVAFVINYISRNVDSFVDGNTFFADLNKEAVLKNLELDKMMKTVSITDNNVASHVDPITFDSSVSTICDGDDVCYTMQEVSDNNINTLEFTDLKIHFNSYSTNSSYELVFEPLKETLSTKYGQKQRTTFYSGLYPYELLFLHYTPTDENQSNVALGDMNTTFHRVFDTEFDVISGYNQKGILQLFQTYEPYIDNTSNTFALNVFTEKERQYGEQFSNLNNILRFEEFLQNLFSTGIDNGSNLLKFTCNLDEIKDKSFETKLLYYNNLKLEQVSYINEYGSLYHKPTSLTCFSNDEDAQYMHATSNLFEFVSEGKKLECRENLHVGTLGTQNVENVNMSGEVMNIDFLRVYSSMFHEQATANNLFFKSSTGIGDINPENLPEYDADHKDDKGIVYLHNQLLYDKNGAYTIQLLRDVYFEIHSALSLSQSNLDKHVSDFNAKILSST